MLKGLYFTAVGFFFLFWRLISKVTERISTKLGDIFTYDCYLMAKTLFGTDFQFWPNISLQRNMISIIGKKFVSLQELPYMPSNLMNSGPKTAECENGWWIFAHPRNFRIGRHCQLYRMEVYNRQQANFGMCYVVAQAYSLGQQNAGRAHAGLCHASSLLCDLFKHKWGYMQKTANFSENEAKLHCVRLYRVFLTHSWGKNPPHDLSRWPTSISTHRWSWWRVNGALMQFHARTHTHTHTNT